MTGGRKEGKLAADIFIENLGQRRSLSELNFGGQAETHMSLIRFLSYVRSLGLFGTVHICALESTEIENGKKWRLLHRAWDQE